MRPQPIGQGKDEGRNLCKSAYRGLVGKRVRSRCYANDAKHCANNAGGGQSSKNTVDAPQNGINKQHYLQNTKYYPSTRMYLTSSEFFSKFDVNKKVAFLLAKLPVFKISSKALRNLVKLFKFFP